MKKDIEHRQDIDLLMEKFYGKIRKDELLGPIFNHHIAEDKWPAHLVKIGDFWETNLFGIPKFKGNPTAKHINVDKEANYGITQKHFGQWLILWFQTIDELFKGDKANRAKNAARMMGTKQFLAMWYNRPENKGR
ncbi:MAG: group III truncated hemoglobin [Weeksellaceae bacterium]